MAVRVAAIGMNHWHSLYDAAYLRHLNEMPDVEIVAIQDEDKSIAQHRATELGISPSIFIDYRQMIESINPDFVLALGRHDKMAEYCEYLITSGIPFIMEKPMSFTSKELKPLVDLAKDKNAFTSVPLQQRMSEFSVYAKELIKTNQFGPITHFYSRLNRPTSERYPKWGSPWMLDPTISNGGCLRNLGTHGIDIFLHLTGESQDIEVTGAQLSWDTYNQSVEDYASILLKSKSGILGTIEIGNGFPSDGTDGEWKIAFKHAILSNRDNVTTLYTEDGSTTINLPKPNGSPALQAAINAFKNKTPPPITIEDCYNAVRIIDLSYLKAGNPYNSAAV